MPDGDSESVPTPSDVDLALDAAGITDPAKRGVALALYVVMGDVSEDCYCAGWMDGLEHRLWRAVADENDDGRYGIGVITQASRWSMRALADLCGGWWTWADDERQGPVFVPLDEWKARPHA